MQINSVEQTMKLDEYNKVQNNTIQKVDTYEGTQDLENENKALNNEQNEESEHSKENGSRRVLEELGKEIKEFKNTRTELKFGIHEATNQITVKVIDSDTSEVIKEIPSEKILDILGKVLELSGLFVDEKR